MLFILFCYSAFAKLQYLIPDSQYLIPDSQYLIPDPQYLIPDPSSLYFYCNAWLSLIFHGCPFT